MENLPGKADWMNGWRKEGIEGAEGGEKVGIRDSSLGSGGLVGWVGGCAGQQSVGMGPGSGNRGVVE